MHGETDLFYFASFRNGRIIDDEVARAFGQLESRLIQVPWCRSSKADHIGFANAPGAYACESDTYRNFSTSRLGPYP